MTTKLFKFKYQLLLACLLFAFQNFAQTYTPPSQERVSQLIDQINECKSNINELEERINYMEENASAYTLAQYNEVKALLNDSKKCKNAIKKELESIRKDYPGWFNSPNATMSIRSHGFTSPRELQELLSEIQQKIDDLLDGFDDLVKPEH
ncbi:hypothetical protein [Winogradskyella sp. 3972H.M.0a.05]|uniref:hypothetical protein n=1 Tax=Winogradskyella sp. 3972H.M.0a.05 TaxID=2950277 RepID=UPI003398ECB1